MAGGFVLVVGPSGAGKDTVIGLARARLAGDPRVVFPRRLVTREASPYEDHDTLDEAAFERGCRDGAFALHWRAHGLGYALPGSARDAALAGAVVVCNVSRALVEEARRALPQVSVVTVTASEPVLARRLLARARPEDGDIGARLSRSGLVPEVESDLVIVNEAAPEEAAAALVGFIEAKAGGAPVLTG